MEANLLKAASSRIEVAEKLSSLTQRSLDLEKEQVAALTLQLDALTYKLEEAQHTLAQREEQMANIVKEKSEGAGPSKELEEMRKEIGRMKEEMEKMERVEKENAELRRMMGSVVERYHQGSLVSPPRFVKTVQKLIKKLDRLTRKSGS